MSTLTYDVPAVSCSHCETASRPNPAGCRMSGGRGRPGMQGVSVTGRDLDDAAALCRHPRPGYEAVRP